MHLAQGVLQTPSSLAEYAMKPKSIRKWTTAAIAAAALVWQPAGAVPIVGSMSFSDGFASLSSSNTAVVSDLVNIDVEASTLAHACAGVFATAGSCIPSTGTFASSFVLTSPIATQIVYAYNGFVFTVNNLTSPISRTGLACAQGTCNDSLSFSGTGTVTGPAGFDPGAFAMVWTAQGMCTSTAGAAACAPGTASGFWNARVTATSVPEPATLALLGLSAIVMGFSRRRAIA
jgi:PEP-CTERM motif